MVNTEAISLTVGGSDPKLIEKIVNATSDHFEVDWRKSRVSEFQSI